MILDFTRNEKAGLILLFACVTILTYYGWQLFRFLTDDTYIAFRYISNSNLCPLRRNSLLTFTPKNCK